MIYFILITAKKGFILNFISKILPKDFIDMFYRYNLSNTSLPFVIIKYRNK